MICKSCLSELSLINLEPNGVSDSVFVNLGESPGSPEFESSESGGSGLLAQDSSSESVSFPPQKATKMTNETAVTSEPVTQRPKNKGF